MKFQKDLADVQLQQCCKDSIKIIRVKLETGKWLQRIAVPAVFCSLFIGLSKGSGITTIFSVYSTDWEMLARSIAGIPAITKKSIRNIAGLERVKHSGKLQDFWKGLEVAFE